MTAPPFRNPITPLQRWLDDHDMTPTSLAVELAIPKETTLALASGSTERIAQISASDSKLYANRLPSYRQQ